MPDQYTLGIEEEYQLINPETRELWGRASKVLAKAKAEEEGDRVQSEMYRCQIEIATEVCHSLEDVQNELKQARRTVIDAARDLKVAVVAAGTHPFSAWQDQQITRKPRYEKLARNLKQTIRELIIFGCHVHVGLNGAEFKSNPAIAVEVVNRCRVWLAPLLALTANSPFWEGRDTGYDSFRTELWGRLPTSGSPPYFETYQAYEDLIRGLIEIDMIQDPTTLYWDVRLSDRFPTIEFRIADVCMTLEETKMLAGLIKALVRTSYNAILDNKPYVMPGTEILKAAHWTAARYGLSHKLVNLESLRSLPAPELIEQFVAYLEPALRAEGDYDEVVPLVEQVLKFGNGASRQRAWFESTGNMSTVVDRLIEQTAMGASMQAIAQR